MRNTKSVNKRIDSEPDEPMEEEFEIRVFKVDGRWVPDVFTPAIQKAATK